MSRIKVRPRTQNHGPDLGQGIKENIAQDPQVGLQADTAAAPLKNPVQDPTHAIENLDDPPPNEADQEVAIGVQIRNLLEGDRPLVQVRPGRDQEDEEVDLGLLL